jgi:hypothetical protein
MWGKRDAYRVLVRKHTCKKITWVKLGVDGMTILKLILCKQDGRPWNGLV